MSTSITEKLDELISMKSNFTDDPSIRSFEEASKALEDLRRRGIASKRQFNIMSHEESVKMAPFVNRSSDFKKLNAAYQINASNK